MERKENENEKHYSSISSRSSSSSSSSTTSSSDGTNDDPSQHEERQYHRLLRQVFMGVEDSNAIGNGWRNNIHENDQDEEEHYYASASSFVNNANGGLNQQQQQQNQNRKDGIHNSYNNENFGNKNEGNCFKRARFDSVPRQFPPFPTSINSFIHIRTPDSPPPPPLPRRPPPPRLLHRTTAPKNGVRKSVSINERLDVLHLPESSWQRTTDSPSAKAPLLQNLESAADVLALLEFQRDSQAERNKSFQHWSRLLSDSVNASEAYSRILSSFRPFGCLIEIDLRITTLLWILLTGILNVVFVEQYLSDSEWAFSFFQPIPFYYIQKAISTAIFLSHSIAFWAIYGNRRNAILALFLLLQVTITMTAIGWMGFWVRPAFFQICFHQRHMYDDVSIMRTNTNKLRCSMDFVLEKLFFAVFWIPTNALLSSFLVRLRFLPQNHFE